MEEPNTLHYNYLIYKPFGYLSQFTNNDVSKHKKKLLGELFDFPKNIMAIGRLDEKTEGLLLLTTNGKTSQFVRSSKFEKEYYAQVDGDISTDAIIKLQKGVEIGLEKGKYTTKPCKAFKVEPIPNFPDRGKKIRDERHGPTSWVSITLTEGKFRQVRKMTAAVGFPTLRLLRVRIGDFTIGKMQPGEVIMIKDLIKTSN